MTTRDPFTRGVEAARAAALSVVERLRREASDDPLPGRDSRTMGAEMVLAALDGLVPTPAPAAVGEISEADVIRYAGIYVDGLRTDPDGSIIGGIRAVIAADRATRGRRCAYCGRPHPVSDRVAEENPFCAACLPERVAVRAERGATTMPVADEHGRYPWDSLPMCDDATWDVFEAAAQSAGANAPGAIPDKVGIAAVLARAERGPDLAALREAVLARRGAGEVDIEEMAGIIDAVLNAADAMFPGDTPPGEPVRSDRWVVRSRAPNGRTYWYVEEHDTIGAPTEKSKGRPQRGIRVTFIEDRTRARVMSREEATKITGDYDGEAEPADGPVPQEPAEAGRVPSAAMLQRFAEADAAYASPDRVLLPYAEYRAARASRKQEPAEPARAPRIQPVTDPEDDAPDGAVIDGYERVGDQWVWRGPGVPQETAEAAPSACPLCGMPVRAGVLCDLHDREPQEPAGAGRAETCGTRDWSSPRDCTRPKGHAGPHADATFCGRCLSRECSCTDRSFLGRPTPTNVHGEQAADRAKKTTDEEGGR